MFATQTPLKVILNPVDAQAGFPGETLELHVIVINQGDRGAAINIFLDRVSQTLSQWCPNTQTRLALDPQRRAEELSVAQFVALARELTGEVN